jgi:two-component system, chemotaxis family, protein-glutamate methylesterase/glutaminase
MVARNIIAIGASAGGFEAIQKITAAFPADLRAAVFVTLHLFERSEGILPKVLNRMGPLPAMHPWDSTPIEMGRIYVAPPDYHLLLTPTSVHLGHGPKENMQRPCINTMFRSAAAAHGERVIGVLLTGLLDDGAAGLWDIQQHGGATVAQDPEEAAFRSMPESAIRGLNVQYILRLSEMAPLVTRLTMGDEHQETYSVEEPKILPSQQACPECGGAMKLEQRGGLREYSCHVGHRFGLKTMIAEKAVRVEQAMSHALSQSEELVELLREESKAGLETFAADQLTKEVEQRQKQIQTLRNMLEREMVSSLQS